MITIYTDGSARGNPGPGGWGAVVVYNDSRNNADNTQNSAEARVTELGGREDHTTNNRMELKAVIESLKFVSKLQATSSELQATVHTDSEYIVKGITAWVSSWIKNNWRTAARKPVLNQDLWQELVSVVEDKDIKWQLVRGHSGVFLNERCDVIATSFADHLPEPLYDGPREGYKFS